MAETPWEACGRAGPPLWRGQKQCIREREHRDHPLFFKRTTGRPVKLTREQHVTASGRIWPFGKINAEFA